MSVQPILVARRLQKRYTRRAWLTPEHPVEALCGVDLEVQPATTLGIVGESGSGKSTLARCITRLERPDSGEIWFEGTEITHLGERQLRGLRPRVQLILQHAAGALNPRFTAFEAIEEPLLLLRRGTSSERKAIVRAAFEAVGLPAASSGRRVLEFSGGQRQRLSIARALALEPAFLVLDEALTGLDLPIQGQILDVLRTLQRERRLTYVFISHDLDAVAHIADDIAVMRRGTFIERAPAAQLLKSPSEEYSKALVEAQRALSVGASA